MFSIEPKSKRGISIEFKIDPVTGLRRSGKILLMKVAL